MTDKAAFPVSNDDAVAGVPDDVPRCDHICLLDDGHVERGEPHFYGYEIPSPRRPGRDITDCPVPP